MRLAHRWFDSTYLELFAMTSDKIRQAFEDYQLGRMGGLTL